EFMELFGKNEHLPYPIKSSMLSPKLWNNVRPENWKFAVTSAKDFEFDPDLYWLDPNDQVDAPDKKRSNEAKLALRTEQYAQYGLRPMQSHGFLPTFARSAAAGNILTDIRH